MAHILLSNENSQHESSIFLNLYFNLYNIGVPYVAKKIKGKNSR